MDIGQGAGLRQRSTGRLTPVGRKGRILKSIVDEDRIIHIDALPLHRKFGDVFLYTDVPEAERIEVAREVADEILTMLKEERVSDE